MARSKSSKLQFTVTVKESRRGTRLPSKKATAGVAFGMDCGVAFSKARDI
jgi:hypothetical protein